MANKKSAKKRIVQTEKKNSRNSLIRSACRTAEKKFRAEVSENNKEAALQALKIAQVKYDTAVAKGVYHQKTVARKVGRLTQLANSL